MKVIIGSQECGKTTILLHYVYNELSKLIEGGDTDKMVDAEDPSTNYEVCLITSKKKLNESNMFFGIYVEVSIDTLK